MRILLPILVLVVLTPGCGSTKGAIKETQTVSGENLKSAEVEPRARNAFQIAERAGKSGKTQAAIEAYRAIKRDFPGGAAAELASYRLGTLYYTTSNYPAAISEFQNFLSSHPESELSFDVTYNLAATLYQQGDYARASQTLSRLSADTVRAQGPRRAEVVYQLGAQSAAAANDSATVITYQAQHLQLPLEDAKRQSLQTSIASELERLSQDELRGLLPKVNESTTKARITERLLAATTPVTPAATVASTGVASAALGNATSGDRSRIGVILPLTGPQAQYGKRALDGILLAARVFQGDSDFEVIAEDSASNPAQAANAVDRLVQEQGVIAIIGPTGWKESEAVGERAQELGVLNISLTGKEGISERGAYLFQNALTARVQMENLVKHAIEQKELRRFAIMAPQGAFGDDMALQFTAAVNRLGGKVVELERYPADAKDFQEPVRRMVNLFDLRPRRNEFKALDAFVKEQEKTRRHSKARLPPIVDFDAVFLPDGPRAAAQIAASFAYFDVANIVLLGTSEWNSDQLYKRGGRLVEKALFPGAMILGSEDPRQREFAKAYVQAYGSMPDLLAAQAFEAMQLASRAAQSSGGNRNNAVSALQSGTRFESPLGELWFDANRTALRVLPILGLAPGGTIIAQ